MLGATSLSDAITQIDDLNRVADQSEQVVADDDAPRAHASPACASALSEHRAQVDADLAAAQQRRVSWSRRVPSAAPSSRSCAANRA